MKDVKNSNSLSNQLNHNHLNKFIMKNTRMSSIQRKTVNSKLQLVNEIYTVKINSDVPTSHNMIQSEINAIFESERLAQIEADRKRKAAKKKAIEAKLNKTITQKEAIVEEGKKMNPAKRKKFYNKKKVNNYVKHQ